MKKILSGIKKKIMGEEDVETEDEVEHEYVELDTDTIQQQKRLTVRPFSLADFEDVKPILDSLREGHTIALVNIKLLKDKDLIELKRAINKLKKTCDAIEGEIAGFGEDWIVATPQLVRIHKSQQTQAIEE